MTSHCRACGAAIVFVATPQGKLQPQDLDGTVHFATCPARLRSPHPADVCLVCGSLEVTRRARGRPAPRAPALPRLW